MNRIIKFRVWDKSLNKYVYTDSGFYIRESETGGYRLVFNLSDGCWRGDYIIEQFTGLLDKNNKEIYEGDILESTQLPEENVKFFERGIVKYYDRFARFGLEFYSPNGYEGYTGKNQHISDFVANGNFVVGNVLENPELLEEIKI